MDYANEAAAIESGALAAIFGTFFVLFLLIFVVSIVFIVISIIGQWKMFKKANEEGWKAIIPIYNTITLCKLVGVTPWWILICFCISLLGSIPYVGSIFTLAGTASALYFTVILSLSTARSYSKSDAFGIGFIFNITKPFFNMIAGTSESAVYVGPKPLGDPVWDWAKETFGGNNSNNASNNTNNQNVTEADVKDEKSKFCPSCGEKLEKDAKTCPSCGKEL